MLDIQMVPNFDSHIVAIQYHLAKWNQASQKYIIVQLVELNTDHFYRP